MPVTVDTRSAVPPYEQIRSQIVHLVALGALQPGQRLPTVRQLAGDLKLAAGTVARAYRELDQAGIVVSRRGNGTYVSHDTRPWGDQERLGRLKQAAAAYVAQARQLDIDCKVALSTVAHLFDQHDP
jgi:GntR family transcriptional regulator